MGCNVKYRVCVSGAEGDRRRGGGAGPLRRLLRRFGQRASQLPVSARHGAAEEGGSQDVRPGQHQGPRYADTALGVTVD